MDPVSASIVNAATSMNQQSLQSQAAVAVLKKAMDIQASNAAQLIQSLPQPQLATSGTLGTLVNAIA